MVGVGQASVLHGLCHPSHSYAQRGRIYPIPQDESERERFPPCCQSSSPVSCLFMKRAERREKREEFCLARGLSSQGERLTEGSHCTLVVAVLHVEISTFKEGEEEVLA